MAYSAPPTFADNSAPTAVNLNVLSDDITYLYGIRARDNLPVITQTGNDQDWTADGKRWTYQIIHQHDSLAIGYVISSVDLTSIPAVHYDGNLLVPDGTTFSKSSAGGGVHTYTACGSAGAVSSHEGAAAS